MTEKEERAAVVDAVIRRIPEIFTKQFAENRLGRKMGPLEEESLRERMRIPPAPLSDEAKEALGLSPPAEAKAAARIPAEQEEDIQF